MEGVDAAGGGGCFVKGSREGIIASIFYVSFFFFLLERLHELGVSMGTDLREIGLESLDSPVLAYWEPERSV